MRVHVLPTDRFKTFAISVYMGLPLMEDTVTHAALTPFVLKRGTRKHPETIQFREKLDDLYGAGFGFDIYKRGDYQIVQFRMDTIQDQYVAESDDLLKQSLEFIGDVILDPFTEKDQFREKYVNAEKNTLKKRIEAIINDKIKYAAERCIQEMCKNEPYRLQPLGQINDLQKITSSNLYIFYQSWLQDATIDIYVVGDTSLDKVEEMVTEFFPLKREKEVHYIQHKVKKNVKEVNHVIEKLDVSQGKLNMGLRSSITFVDDLYPAALMYNGILGGYPHSKLFINVREKESLAYYASSRLDGHKGLMTIQSGIEIKNFDKAVEIILKQLESMKDGHISELEMKQTQAMIINHLKEIQDSAFEMIAFDFNRILSGRQRTESELIEQITKINIKQIQQIASDVQLDTIYFLRDKKGE